MRSRFALLALGLAGAFTAWAATAPLTKITVQVTAADGKPVEGAQVVARFVKGPAKPAKNVRPTWAMGTDPHGMAAGPPIPQGTIVVDVSAPGFESSSQKYDIDAPDKTIQVKLNPGLPTTQLTVRVVDKEGDALENAEVEVKQQGGPEVKSDGQVRSFWQLRTDAQGIAQIPGGLAGQILMPQGRAALHVAVKDFRPLDQTVDLNQPAQTITATMAGEVSMTRLNVLVTTLGGKPLENADVVVRFVSGRSVIKLGKKIRTTWEMRTNQDGVAKVPEIPAGSIRIQVIAKGYQTFGETYDVEDPEKSIAIKMNPPQEQYTAH